MEKQIKMTDDDHDREVPIIIAMKGHPGSGKSTLAHSIAKVLKCPLIDKDHFRDCTKSLQEVLMLGCPTIASKLLNDLSYEVIWQIASTQLSLGLTVVIDSPLSRRSHLDRLLQLAAETNARLVVVECKPQDEAEWRRRLELRGAADESSWHKPNSWQEMKKLLDGYAGCWDYDVGEVPKLALDTTANLGVEELVSSVLDFVKSNGHRVTAQL
ncbi:hypothetical protein ACH5RR_036949 [Cinchona calisaya]|uniref:Uncharacterized protein n=1 Tax=Cinchona calisaya TaxID=153742 RepID=A0ABD2Y8H9_9GENT